MSRKPVENKAAKKGKNIIRDTEKAESSTIEKAKIHFQTVKLLPLPWWEIRIAEKTTLFNQLTGSKQHVGNFPGVTVDRKRRCDKRL